MNDGPLLSVLVALAAAAPLAVPRAMHPARTMHPDRAMHSAREDPHTRSRGALLEGVEAIAAPGVPGDVVAFGARAFAVVCDPDGRPVVTAAEGAAKAKKDAAGIGAGRALVLGHDGYLAEGVLEREDTGRFLTNALRWVGGKQRPAVACLDPKHAPVVRALGATVSDEFDPRKDDVVLLALAAPLAPERRAELAAFVRAGGGLLGAATGWGWKSGRPADAALHELPGNRLLAELGLAVGAGTVREDPAEGDQGAAGGQDGGRLVARPVGALAHAGTALEALRAGGLARADEDTARARVAAALDALDDHEPTLILPLRRALEGTADDDAALRRALPDLLSRRELRPLGQRFGPWWLLGPVAAPRADVTRTGPAERGLERFASGGPGPDADDEQRGFFGRTRWRELDVAGDARALDVGALALETSLAPPPDAKRPPPLEDFAAYLGRALELDEPAELALELETGAAVRVWIDGELVLEQREGRPGTLELPLVLDAGKHWLLVKLAAERAPLRLRLQSAGDGLGPGAVDAAVGRAVEHLLRHQLVDGSWAGHGGYGPGLTALVLKALLASGLDPDEAAARRAWAFIDSREALHTYSLSPVIQCALALERGQPSEATRELVERLIAMQEPSGLYSYPVHPGGQLLPADLSTTLYASLALHEAARAGLRVPDRVWKGLLEGALSCWRGGKDDPVRGFSYRPARIEAHWPETGSMTGAGLTVLAIAREGLEGRVDRGLLPKLERALEGGRAWLEERLVFDTNPGEGNWHFFHLYGIERVGELFGTAELGGLRWYPAGARYLIERQKENGAFVAVQHGEELRDTALALLFLGRATRPATGRRSSRVQSLTGPAGGPNAVLSVTGRGPYELWIADWLELDPAAVTLVRYLARRTDAADEGEVELARAEPRPEAPVQRFEARAAPPAPGAWKLTAELTTSDADGTRTLRTGAVELLYDALDDPEVLAYAGEGLENLLRGVELECEASSGTDPAAAADGSQASSWSSEAQDTERRLTLRLNRPVQARRLALSHALPHLADPGRRRPTAVLVTLGKEPLGRFELDPSPWRKTSIDLGVGRRIASLELVLEGPAGANLGLAEVELLAGP